MTLTVFLCFGRGLSSLFLFPSNKVRGESFRMRGCVRDVLTGDESVWSESSIKKETKT